MPCTNAVQRVVFRWGCLRWLQVLFKSAVEPPLFQVLFAIATRFAGLKGLVMLVALRFIAFVPGGKVWSSVLFPPMLFTP